MAVNMMHVRRHVYRALKATQPKSAGWIDNVHRAWEKLRDQRQQPGQSLDLSLAGAEHYLFARFVVASGETSEGQMINLVQLYYAKKRWDAFWGDPNAEAITKNPVSKPDPEVMYLGMLGAKHGAADHTAYKVEKQPPLWRPVGEVLTGDTSTYALGYGTASQE